MRSSCLLLLLFAATSMASTDSSLFESGSHCVAYKARKTMFLLASNEVVGKNCDISAQVLPEVGGLYHIEVNIPLSGFQSGDSSRDEDVMKTLKSDVKSELTFKSVAMTAEQWRALLKTAEFKIAGDLTIGDKSFPLTLTSHYIADGDGEVDGDARVRFKDFDLATPTAGAGLVAKAKPDFELLLKLQGSRILGADTILPPKDENKQEEKK
jgi:polyisoprenoid-binding protein YceI